MLPRPLGPIPSVMPLALGTWAWGNRLLYSYDAAQDAELQATFDAAVARGINLIDTADSYGTGRLNARAEVLLGRFLRESRVDTRDIKIATKFASYPWRTRRGIVNAAERSCERLGRVVDVGQMHWSASRYAPWQERALWAGLGDALAEGYVREVGVSNFGPRLLRRVERYMREERGARVASVQVQLSLLCREPVESGLLRVARELGVGVIGYSPLCLGLLAGRRARGLRGALFRALENAELRRALDEVAATKGCDAAQIAVAWCLRQGVVVLVGCRTAEQVDGNMRALSVSLSDEECGRLEEAARAGRQMVRNAFQTE